jgi:tetratricopeptide (TPR) repeat protein
MMSRSARFIRMTKPVAGAALLLASAACCCSYAQTAPASGDVATKPDAKKPAPTFNAAGIQGNIAPSGYSSGAREEETRQVADLIVQLQAANLANTLSDGEPLNCDLQPELLHAALSQPSSFEANLRLGLFYLQHQDPTLSVKYLSLARDLKPANLNAVRALAIAEVEAHENEAAGRLAARLIDADRADPEAHRIKGSVEAAAGDDAAALADFNLAVSLDPGVNGVYTTSLSLMSLGNFSAAEHILVGGTTAHPEAAKLWLASGMAEALDGKQSQAVDSLLRAAGLDPANLLAPTLLAAQAASADEIARSFPVIRALAHARPAEAIAHYDDALILIKANPASSDPAVNAQIDSELRTAIKEQPQFAAAHFQLGVFEQNAGDAKSAVAELSEAIRLSPDIAEWHYRLSRAYRRSGQNALAESEMQAFQRLKERRDAGANVSAKLLEGLPPDALGVDGQCRAGQTIHP